jgi:hypothetical protein
MGSSAATFPDLQPFADDQQIGRLSPRHGRVTGRVTEGRLRCRFWNSLATRGSAAPGATLFEPNTPLALGRVALWPPRFAEPKQGCSSQIIIGAWPEHTGLSSGNVPSSCGQGLPAAFSTRVEDAGVPWVIDELMSGAVVAGYTAPYSGWRASSPNRNDSRTKRRPAVTSRTSCRCEQLNSSAAPGAGRYSSGPYSGKRS